MNFLFMVHACEEQNKENLIEALCEEDDPLDRSVQEELASRMGIYTGAWTTWDWEYINDEVSRRI